MIDTVAPDRRAVRPPGGRLRGMIWGSGRRAFAVTDLCARAYGLQVTESPTGLLRSYRDPRFAHLGICVGLGEHLGPPVTVCGGCGAAFFG